MSKKVLRISVKCLRCGKEFFTKQARINDGRGKYCSKKCCYPERKKYKCLHCGKDFTLPPSRETRNLPKYCCRKCKDEFAVGTFTGPNSHSWNGGFYIDTEGYAFLYQPFHPRKNASNYVRQHILVVEQVLGRFLKSEEVVHHINGIKHDNRPENLYIFPTAGEHISYHGLIRHKKSKVTPITESNLKAL